MQTTIEVKPDIQQVKTDVIELYKKLQIVLYNQSVVLEDSDNPTIEINGTKSAAAEDFARVLSENNSSELAALRAIIVGNTRSTSQLGLLDNVAKKHLTGETRDQFIEGSEMLVRCYQD